MFLSHFDLPNLPLRIAYLGILFPSLSLICVFFHLDLKQGGKGRGRGGSGEGAFTSLDSSSSEELHGRKNGEYNHQRGITKGNS